MQVDNLKIRIKICYISDFAIDLEGAASIHVYEVCSNLQKRDCDVTLVAPNSDIQKPNFQSLNVKCPRLYQTIFFQIKLIPIVHKLWRYNKPDYFYLRSRTTFLANHPFIYLSYSAGQRGQWYSRRRDQRIRIFFTQHA